MPPTAVQVILIISDQASPSTPWETSFQEKGFTTIHETQENAVETCKVVGPALIVVDAPPQHAKRLEFCTRLRAAASGPILLLVPDYDSYEMMDIYNIGVDECILKPISPAFLVVKALSWLLRRRWLEFDPNSSQVYTQI